MRCIVLRDVTVLFLVHLPGLERHIHALVLLDEVLVGLVTGDEDHILVHVREANLGADWVHCRVWNLLLCHTSLLVHLPNVKRLLWLRAQCRQKLVVFGTEGHRDPRLVLLDLV